MNNNKKRMDNLAKVIQAVIALGILNVWILRFGRSTNWRGGSAQNMTEEFAVYGLPRWFMLVIGFLKVSLAGLLIAGIWRPQLIPIAGGAMAALMLGAVLMHAKVQDPLKKSTPAATMLVLALLTILLPRLQ